MYRWAALTGISILLMITLMPLGSARAQGPTATPTEEMIPVETVIANIHVISFPTMQPGVFVQMPDAGDLASGGASYFLTLSVLMNGAVNLFGLFFIIFGLGCIGYFLRRIMRLHNQDPVIINLKKNWK